MSLAIADTVPRAAVRTPPEAVRAGADPDITSAQHWSGAAVGATLWALFILYAASQGVG